MSQKNSQTFISEKTLEYARPGQWPVLQSLETYVSQPPEDVHGYVTAPTGSGKTFIFSRLLEDLRLTDQSSRTLVVTGTSLLVDQTAKDLVDNGFSGKVDPIIGWQEDRGEGDVKVTTYQGFVKHVLTGHGRAINPESYGLVILDEAQHLQGPMIQKALAEFKHAKKLGFTASPDYDEERKLSNILPDHIHDITIREAVAERLIAPYINALLQTYIDLASVHVINGEFRRSQMDSAINTAVRNRQIAQFYVDNFIGQLAMFNVGSIEHAVNLSATLREVGAPSAAYHGRLQKHERNKIISAFESGDAPALVQVRAAGEGYDNPPLSLIFNVTQTASIVWALQRSGRGQRIDPNNPDKISIIIDCVDQNYRQPPLAYGSERVAGAWQLVPKELDPVAKKLLKKLGDISYRGMDFVVGEDKVDPAYNALFERKLNERENEATRGAISAYNLLEEHTTDDQHEIMLGILDDSYAIPDTACREDVVFVLKLLAGTIELNDTATLKRFQTLNAVLTQDPDRTFIRLTKRQSEGRHSFKLPKTRN